MNLKYSISGQIISVILAHFKAVFICFLLWLVAIAVTVSKTGGAIYTVIATVFYCASMYSACRLQALDDKKSHSPLTPVFYKGALLSIGLLVINLAAVLVYVFIWRTASDGENLVNMPAVAANVFYLFWFSPLISFLSDKKGEISVILCLTAFILPFASCFLGYLAGYKNFDISAKLKFFVYEKEK